MEFDRVEISKSNQSKCRICRKKIDFNETRLVRLNEWRTSQYICKICGIRELTGSIEKNKYLLGELELIGK